MAARSLYARGWFVLAWADEVAPGDVQAIQAFGQHLVLFRAEDGTLGLLDAHCPHLGARLGVGGKVEGDSVVCPFHAWALDGSGTCTKIPYAEKIPKQAVTRGWPVIARNGVVHGWHDPAGGGPDWEMHAIPEYGAEGWTGWSTNSITVMDGYLKSRPLLAHTPIDGDSLVLRFGVMLQETGDMARDAAFAKGYVDNLTTGFHEDIRIWENKTWRDRPAICDGDGPIGRLRTRYRQFFEEQA